MAPPFLPLPGRDAAAVIRGFLYQIQLTVLRWITLEQNVELELECGEDIDIVCKTLEGNKSERTLEQVKYRSQPLSLRSPAVLTALVNFYLSQQNNPEIRLSFRFITNCAIAPERSRKANRTVSAIQLWNGIADGTRSGDVAEDLNIVREIITAAPRPANVRRDDWQSLTSFFQTARDSALLGFLKSVEWSFGNPSVPDLAGQIRSEVVERGFVDASNAESAQNQLLSQVLKHLSSSGRKRLTYQELERAIRNIDRTAVNPILLGMVQTLVADQVRTLDLQQQVRTLIHGVGGPSDGMTFVGTTVDVASGVSLSVPPLIAMGSLRSSTVDKCIQALEATCWLSLQGESGCGKTQLSILMAGRTGTALWIDLRGIEGSHEAVIRLESSLNSAARSTRDANTEAWYAKIIDRLPTGSMLFVDDLPVDDIVIEKLVVLARCAMRKRVKIVSTSRRPLVPSPSEWLGSDFLEISAPHFSDSEIQECCAKNGAPLSLPADVRFIELVASVTRRHPQLVACLVRYMRNSEWRYNASTALQLIRGDFATDARLRTRQLLARTLPDATRELLYRLNVVGPYINCDDVLLVGRVHPQIGLPLDKLSECLDVWVQRRGNDMFVLSALLSQVGQADIPEDTKTAIHLAKAAALLKLKRLNQFQAFSACFHFQMGGDMRSAAFVLLTALMGLNEVSASRVDDFGLLELWVTEIPQDVPPELQVVLRALQIAARKRHGKPYDRLLTLFDELLKHRALKPPHTFVACSCVGVNLINEKPDLAVEYIMQALHHEDSVKDLLPKSSEQELVDMLWMAAPSLKTMQSVKKWLNMVGHLSLPQRKRLFSLTEIATKSARVICDSLWTAAVDRKEANFLEFDKELEDLYEVASNLSASALLPYLVRARVAIASSYQKDLGKATQLTVEAIAALGNGHAKFILSFTLANGFDDCGHGEEAIAWFSQAIETQRVVPPIPEFQVRAYLSRAKVRSQQGVEGVEADCQAAVDYTQRTPDLSELLLISSLAELAIAKWARTNKLGFYETWQEVIERTFAARSNNPEWRRLFVLNGNNAAYFASTIRDRVPETTVTKPFQGMYMLHSPQLESLYAPETDWYAAASMVWLAEGVGRFNDAARWALRAFEMASRSPLGAQAGFFLTYAMPQMVRERRYTEAIEFVLESAKSMQASDDATAIFAELRGKPELLASVRGRKPRTPAINAELLTLTLLPIVFDLATWKTSDLETAMAATEDLIAKCEELAPLSTAPIAWQTAAHHLASTFSIRHAANAEAVSQGPEETQYLARLIDNAANADVAKPVQTFNNWYQPVQFFEQQWGRSFSHIQLMADLVARFWRVALIANPLGFRQPSRLTTSLNELEASQDFRPRDVMRVVYPHIGISIPPDVELWLDEPHR